MAEKSGLKQRLIAPLVLAAFALALPAHADGPVLHEFFEPNPQEDLLLRATTASGRMPAAIVTPSGVVRAPDVLREPVQSELAYGGSSTPGSTDAAYRIDRDTTRPDVVGYDDPFVPAITPFKRLYAYDAVDESLELVVRDAHLEKIPVGGEVLTGEDRFYADMVVDLAQDVPVRIPTVGPGARVLAAYSNPPLKFELVRDGAENWFVRASERQRVRLVMMLALPREVFGGQFPDVGYGDLSQNLPSLPKSVRPAAREVLDEIGVSTALRPREAVARLVSHFRAFAPSSDRPKAPSGAALFKELALSKKGVCRHRAYAFVITALELGLPARMVRNEAHAWVEVWDGKLWRLIDLGGSAGRLEFEQAANTQQYRPPADPYQWPSSGDSGQQMAARSIAEAPGANADGGAVRSAVDGGAAPAPSPTQPSGPAEADAGLEQREPRPAARLVVSVGASELGRGGLLPVAGRVDAEGEACQYARVDVSLRSKTGRLIAIGALPADAEGHFDGAVTVPFDVDVGDYDVVVSTPGDARCGPGKAE